MNTAVFVGLVGASGAGKSTIARHLANWHGFSFLKSVTTRAPRPGEDAQGEYVFTSPIVFESMWAQGRLVERAEHGDNLYGMLAPATMFGKFVSPVNAHGIFDLAGSSGKRHNMEILPVAVLPPDEDTLNRRNAGEGWEARRARDPMGGINEGVALFAGSPKYALTVVNHDSVKAAREVAKFVAGRSK